jgi:alpha-tubulin suppressor-like RCC1 family protein
MRLKTGFLLGALTALATALPVSSASALTQPLYAFGSDSFGQLGDAGTIGSGASPAPVLVTLPGVAGLVDQVSAGGYFSLAVTSGSQLYSFGANEAGQLGRTATTDEPTPALVTLPGIEGEVSETAAGYNFSLVATSAGQLYSFGQNRQGQLGRTVNFGFPSAANPTPALVTLPGATGVVSKVSAGYLHGLALTTKDELYAFGYGPDGQLGYPVSGGANGEGGEDTPKRVTLPGQEGTVTQIAAGGEDSFALTSEGQLYSFGDNSYGQLGTGVAGNDNPTPTIVTLPGGSGNPIQVAAGERHTLVLTSTGDLYSFGENGYGQLGVTTNSGSIGVANTTPALVSLPGATGSIEQIAVGRNYSLVRTSTGQLFAFGENDYGQLGTTTNNGGVTANPTPTLVGTGANSVTAGPFASHTLVLGPYEPYVAPSCNCSGGGGGSSSSNSSTTTTTTTTTTGATTPIATSIPLLVPTISAAGFTSRSFRVGKQATAISAKKAPLGSTLRFTLSTAAKVKLAITRSAPGLRHGRSCVALSATLVRAHAKRCTRTLTVGTFTRAKEAQGADSLPFSGRIGRRPLAAGSYLAVITASNAAGSSKPVAVAFTIIG